MSPRVIVTGIAALAIAAGAAWTFAQDQKKPDSSAEFKPMQMKEGPAKAALDRLKKLAGEWVAKDAKGDDAKKPVLTYRVVSGGSAVLEFIMPGTEHEMVTMYHLDGDFVMLTHYCMLGNQPRMKSKGLAGKKLDFDCSGGTNMKSEKDTHMHSASFEFVDDNHFISAWQMHAVGKANEHRATFDVVRMK